MLSRYTDKPKDNMIKFRADKEISEKLDSLAKKKMRLNPILFVTE